MLGITGPPRRAAVGGGIWGRDRPGEAFGGVMLDGFVGEVGLFNLDGSVGFGEAEGE